MKFTPTCICPNCKKEMVIAGTQCPYCKFSFTREMVDRFIFSCPKCRSRKIKIKQETDTGRSWDLTVENAKYYAIVNIAQAAIGSGRNISFECGDCGHKFDSTSFLLQEKDTEELPKENKETTDSYGNRVKIEHFSNGKSKKITFPARGGWDNFEFLEDTYNRRILNECKEVKVYHRDNKIERVLKRDCYGRFLLYFYDDWGMDDRIDELWKVVADEAEADEFVGVYRLSRLCEPYIAGDGGDFMTAHEWI